jgi:hypothetical protein
MKMQHVWVVEIFDPDGKWRPTIGCGLTRKHARNIMYFVWQTLNPDDKFRVTKYVREADTWV